MRPTTRARRKTAGGKDDEHQKFTRYAQRLLKAERGEVPVKNNAPLRMALVYPNEYALGMASVGFQTVFRHLNTHPDASCERAFALGAPGQGAVRTLESKTPIHRFDVVAFSISFELDLYHVIDCLKRSGIAPLRKDRTGHDPLVIAGGVVPGLNPSPLFHFMDGLLVGEGEGLFFSLLDTLARFHPRKSQRSEVGQALSQLESVLVPGISQRVKRHVVDDLEPTPAYTPIVTPHSHFSNMFVLEVGRGCPRGCTFCAAQKIYSPFRYRSMDNLLATIKEKNPGAQKIGLEGAGFSDYPQLVPLCEKLLDEGYRVSFSSVRADQVDEGLLNILKRTGTRTFTIAPEAGTQSLRYRIKKGMSDALLMDKVRLLASAGIQVLKLYYLIGLPGETGADVQAIAELTLKLAEAFSPKGKKQIRVSVNAFIPKPFTEFQWAPMATPSQLKDKRKVIASGLSKDRRIQIVKKSVREERVQGLLSVGDESMGLALYDAVQRGESVYHLASMDTVFEERSFSQPLPWDIIENNASKESLWKQYRRIVSPAS